MSGTSASNKDANPLSVSTINATTTKGNEICSLIQNVTKNNMSEVLSLLTDKCTHSPVPNAYKTCGSITMEKASAAALNPVSPFHARRYAIIQCTRLVLGDKNSSNTEERLALLQALIAAAVKEQNAISLLCDMFWGMPTLQPAAVTDFLEKQLKLSAARLWTVLIALCHTTQESYRTTGRRLLEAKMEELRGGIASVGLSEETLQSLRTLLATDSVMKVSAATRAVREEHYLVPQPLKMPEVSDALASLSQSFSLAGVIEEMGPGCVSTVEDCAYLLDLAPSITPKLVAECIAVLTLTSFSNVKDNTGAFNSLRCSIPSSGKESSGKDSTNHTHNFVSAVKERAPTLDWIEVLKALDNPRVKVDKFIGIASAYKKATSNPTLPCEVFLGRWKNVHVQSLALRFLLDNPSLGGFPTAGNAKHFHILPNEISSTERLCVGWRCIEFVEAICYVCSRSRDMESVVLAAAAECPSVVFAALTSCRPQGSLAHLALASAVLRQCGVAALTDHVVRRTEKDGHASLLVGLLGELVTSDPPKFLDVVELLCNAKLVHTVLASRATEKLLVGCAVAGMETKLTPDGWLEKQLEATTPFTTGYNRFGLASLVLECCDEFLTRQRFVGSATTALKLLVSSSIGGVLPSVAAHAKTLLENGDSSFPPEIEAEARTLYKEFIEQSKGHHHGDTRKSFEKMQELYTSSATNEKDKKLFNCIVNILFEENKLKGASTALSSLTAAAQLLGFLIDKDMLSQQRIQAGLQFVLTCLNKTEVRLQEFGVLALECFYQRVPQWPQFAQQLLQLQNIYLDNRIPGIMAIIHRSLKEKKAKEDAEAAEKEGNTNNNNNSNTTTTAPRHGGFLIHPQSLSILMENDDLERPEQSVTDRINFLCGNLDNANLASTAADIKRLVNAIHYPYFADYLVKRVTLEPNHHAMYLDLLKALQLPELDTAVRLATVRSVNRILESDKIRSEYGERTGLKALGMWYGQMTLARSIPINAKELYFREMIDKALRDGKLIGVVPFIAKVLDSCKTPNSIFRPKNPWTMCQLGYLVELYAIVDLKLTLRFEIEVLFNTLSIQMNEVENFMTQFPRRRPPGELTMQQVRNTIDITQSTDFRAEDPNLNQPQPRGGPTTRFSADATPYTPPQQQPIPSFPYGELGENSIVITDDARYFEKCSGDRSYPSILKQFFMEVLESSRELVDRWAQYVLRTTRAMILKDFITDTADPTVVHRSSVNMIRSLAANLLLPVCEQFAKHFHNEAKMKLLPAHLQDTEEGAMLSSLIYDNNSAMLMRCLETMAAHRAEEMQTEYLQGAVLTMEERQRQEALRQEIHESNIYIPDVNVGRIYDEFTDHLPLFELQIGRLRSIEDTVVRYEKNNPDIEFPSLFAIKNTSTEQEPKEIRDMRDRINELESISADVAHVLMSFLYKRLVAHLEFNMPRGRVSNILGESYLIAMCRCRSLMKDKNVFTQQYFKNLQKWRNYPDFVIDILRSELMTFSDFDAMLVAQVTAERQEARNGNDRPLYEFAVRIVNKFIELNIPFSKYPQLWAELRQTTLGEEVKSIRLVPYFKNTPEETRKHINDLFDEWINICSNKPRMDSESHRKLVQNYMEKLQSEAMLKATTNQDGLLDRMLSVMMELSVEHYATVALQLERRTPIPLPQATKPGTPPPFRYPPDPSLFTKVDTFTDFLQTLLKCCASGSNTAAADPKSFGTSLLQKIFQVITCVLQHNHDTIMEAVTKGEAPALPEGMTLQPHEALQEVFQQQPYVRCFSNLMLAKLKLGAQPTDEQRTLVVEYVRLFLEALRAVTPLKAPGFAFGWMELISHRFLTGRALEQHNEVNEPPPRSWNRYANTLIEGLKFLESLSRSEETLYQPGTVLFTKSFLKLLLVMLHDFQNFLQLFHVQLCEYIPNAFLQLRNVVLCAYPHQVRLPDPFQFDMDKLPSDMAVDPPVLTTSSSGSHEALTQQLQCDISAAVYTGPEEKAGRILEQFRNDYGRWNIRVICAAVIEIVRVALQVTKGTLEVNDDNPAVRLFVALCRGFDTEGRYYMINAMTNQLRYPNSHTHFFMRFFMYLFGDHSRGPFLGHTKALEQTQEQVLRVLVERLRTSRPHPWGLLVTFSLLVRTDKFAGCSFTKCSSEVDKALHQLASTVRSGPSSN